MHGTILETRHQHWADEAACESAARSLAQRAALQDAFVELAGPLGAGKTTFVRHLLRALGVAGRIKSPSYAVVEPYDLPGHLGHDDGHDQRGPTRPAWHFDFYRFGDEREWQDAGFREIFAGPGLKLVEWAANAGPSLPTPDLRMELMPLEHDQRSVTFSACTPRGRALLP